MVISIHTAEIATWLDGAQMQIYGTSDSRIERQQSEQTSLKRRLPLQVKAHGYIRASSFGNDYL